MNHFSRLYKIYEGASRWYVVKQIFKHSGTASACGMLACFLVFITLVLYTFFSGRFTYSYWGMLVTMIVWSLFFVKARGHALHQYYLSHTQTIRLHERNYQYIRYLIFKEAVVKADLLCSVKSALTHANIQIETEEKHTLSGNILITTLLGLLFAVVGGYSGKLDIKLFVNIALFILAALYFAYHILGSIRTSHSKILEFKRYLLWLRVENIGA